MPIIDFKIEKRNKTTFASLSVIVHLIIECTEFLDYYMQLYALPSPTEVNEIPQII